MEKKKNCCRYKRVCDVSGPGCFNEDEDNCPQAIILYLNCCPLMVGNDKISKNNCGCDIQQIRELWPAGKKCFAGNICLPREHEQVRKQVVSGIKDRKSILEAFSAA